jgi:hypothetical protein
MKMPHPLRSTWMLALAGGLIALTIGCTGAGEQGRNSGKDKPRPDDHGALRMPPEGSTRT